MRPAIEADLDRVRAFLTEHITTSMFPMSNLARFGTNGHPRSMDFWLSESAGEVTDLFSISREGMIFPGTDKAATVIPFLTDRPIIGIIGATSQVTAIRDALPAAPTKINTTEPHFALNLAQIKLPQIDGLTLRPVQETDAEMIINWRAAYEVESLGEDLEAARNFAEQKFYRYLQDDTHRVLMHKGSPVGTTGFNAVTESCVQVGGVYTPPELRSRGYARAAVALHLQEAHAHGKTTAILCAANVAAAKAYMAIGFEQIGEFGIVIYQEPQVIHV